MDDQYPLRNPFAEAEAAATPPVTVYRNGKIERAEVGQRAGTFLPAGGSARTHDIVAKNGDTARFVDENYTLQPGDLLVITQRGQAG